MILSLPLLMPELGVHLDEHHGGEDAEVDAEEGEVVDVLDEGEEGENDGDEEAEDGSRVLKAKRERAQRGVKSERKKESGPLGSTWSFPPGRATRAPFP